MGRYLLYVSLNPGESSAEFDTVDEVIDATTELIKNTFESDRQLITFSIGDMAETVREADLHEEKS